jgi:hypothetical protein
MKTAPAEIFFSCSESPTRVNLTCVSLEQQLAASSSGTISLSKNFEVQEEWYLIPSSGDDDDGETVLIKSVKHGFYLACNQHTKTIVTSETMDLAMHWSILASSNKEGDDEASNSVQFVSSSTDPEYKDSYKYKLGHTEDGMLTAHPDAMLSSWKIQLLTGELCFLSNPFFDKRLRCDVFGKLNMDSNWKGWEVFRFIEDGDGRLVITSWTHDSKFLSCDAKGDVIMKEQNKRDDCDKWTVQKAKHSSGVLLESVTFPGRFLCFDGDSLCIVENMEHIGVTWDLQAANRNLFYISNPFHDRLVSSRENGDLFTVTHKHNRIFWEQWKVERADEGGFTIFSDYHAKYLTTASDGSLMTVDHPEKWSIGESPHGGIFITSPASERQISCDRDGNLSTTQDICEKSESWFLEPCMPSSKSKGQLTVLGATCAAALALSVAAPFVVMGGVAGLGFGAEGIVAGSTAAAMMSAEATVAGGGILAGGTVATLQSIGAAGLGFAGTTMAVSGGALTGGLIGGSTASALVRDNENRPQATLQQEEEDSVNDVCRPLASWRFW